MGRLTALADWARRSWRGNLLFILLLGVSSAAVTSFFSSRAERVRERQVTIFGSNSDSRHAQLVHEIDKPRALLKAMVALYSASEHVEPSEFAQFAQELLEPESSLNICWQPSGLREAALGSQPNARAAAGGEPDVCGLFDPLEPSRVVSYRDHLYLMLSADAESSVGSQRGFVSVVFDVRDLMLDDPQLQLEEHLLMVNRLTNTLRAYDFESQVYDPDTTFSFDDDVLYKYFPIAEFGRTNFVYLARHKPTHLEESSMLPALFSALVVLCLLFSLYVRDLLLKKESISREVALRTEELSQFAFRTSHDLRAPLLSISGLARAMQEDLAEGIEDDLNDNLEKIREQATRLDRLVLDILQLSRADIKAESWELVDLETLSSKVKEAVERSYPDSGVSVSTEVRGPSLVKLPRARITQVLENLLSNSVKYSDPSKQKPCARLSISAERDKLNILVSDNGLGIPQKYHPRLFKMFERFNSNPDTPGSGLGMSIVKKHIDKLNGLVDVESSPAGTAVRIRLRLPNRG